MNEHTDFRGRRVARLVFPARRLIGMMQFLSGGPAVTKMGGVPADVRPLVHRTNRQTGDYEIVVESDHLEVYEGPPGMEPVINYHLHGHHLPPMQVPSCSPDDRRN